MSSQSNRGGWVRIAPHIFANVNGDRIEMLDNRSALINGERIIGRELIRTRRLQLEKR